VGKNNPCPAVKKVEAKNAQVTAIECDHSKEMMPKTLPKQLFL